MDWSSSLVVVLNGLALLPLLVLTGASDAIPLGARVQEGLRSAQGLPYMVFIMAMFIAVVHVRSTMGSVLANMGSGERWTRRHGNENAFFFWSISLSLLAISVVSRVAPHNISQSLYVDGSSVVWSGSISRRDPPLGELIGEGVIDRLILRDNRGGDVETAERVAESLNELGVRQVIAEGTCASACAHLWALSESRALGANSVIGLHPAKSRRFRDGTGRLVVDQPASDLVTERLVEGLVAAGAEREALLAIFKGETGRMQWLGYRDLQALGVRFESVDE